MIAKIMRKLRSLKKKISRRHAETKEKETGDKKIAVNEK
jgi:hypothetical protein